MTLYSSGSKQNHSLRPNRQRIHILIPTFQPHDAVGNDAAGMYQMLRSAGYDARLYAQYVHEVYAPVTQIINDESDACWQDPDALMIYHHAIVWEVGEKILNTTRNRIVIKYHNVTPPEFFTNYAQHYYWACVKGKQSNTRLANLDNALFWGDSQYNNDEFIGLGVAPSRCRVLPPIHRVEELAREPFDSVVLGAYRGDTANLLFVGGLRPNKGHAKGLEVLAALQRLTPQPCRLMFVGSFDPNLAGYAGDLEQYVRHLDLAEDVVFARSVSPSQLRAYYMSASVFLCVSEHEGFCVPLIEAMAFRVPVVAWATTAVGETAGGCGLIYDRFDPEALAEGIAESLENQQIPYELAERGRVRYESMFHPEAIRQRLLELTEEALLQ